MADLNDSVIWPGWETVRLIGHGSFGTVYEIERDILGEKEKAALKVITIPQRSSDIDELYGEGYDDDSITNTFKEHLKNIVAEYSLMRKMNGSANVVSCNDIRYVQHDDGFGWDIFIKMELLTPLTKALGKDVSDEQVVRIGSDICKALILCKKHNIIHRDIKPGNIFVSENGDYKLGDFGIAKTVEKTSGGTKIGTYEYMAPEVYHDQPYGSTVDIYSLGMVLYWLLNERRTPFLKMPPALPTNTEKEQARKRRFSGEAIPAPVHGSKKLKQIVLKACAYDPKDRYQSAEEMHADFDIFQNLLPTSSSAISTFGEEKNNDGNAETPIATDVNEGATVSVLYQEPYTVNDDETVGAFAGGKAKEETDRVERERQAEQERLAAEKAAKRRKRITAIVTSVLVVIVTCIACQIVLTSSKLSNPEPGKYVLNVPWKNIDWACNENCYFTVVVSEGFSDEAKEHLLTWLKNTYSIPCVITLAADADFGDRLSLLVDDMSVAGILVYGFDWHECSKFIERCTTHGVPIWFSDQTELEKIKAELESMFDGVYNVIG